MRVGISLTSAHRTRDPREAAQFMIERTAAARRAGLDSLFLGDHHATPYYQNTPMLGRLLAEWGDRPAGCLFLLPLWHPVLVAEHIGTLAAIARGRFIMQCGLGYGQEQFDAMGVDIRHRPSLFEQSLDIVRRLLAGETVTTTGRVTLTRASIAPCPAEPVEVWIGASARPAIDRAARLGDAFLAAPGLGLEEARAQAEFYLARVKAYGKGTPAAVAIRRDIYVGESSADASAVLDEAIAKGYRGIAREALIAGTVDEVVESFRAIGDLGYTDVIVRHLTNDQPRVLASLARLEHVRRAVASA